MVNALCSSSERLARLRSSCHHVGTFFSWIALFMFFLHIVRNVLMNSLAVLKTACSTLSHFSFTTLSEVFQWYQRRSCSPVRQPRPPSIWARKLDVLTCQFMCRVNTKVKPGPQALRTMNYKPRYAYTTGLPKVGYKYVWIGVRFVF